MLKPRWERSGGERETMVVAVERANTKRMTETIKGREREYGQMT